MKRFAAVLIIIFLLLPFAAQAQGVSPSPPKSAPSSGGGSSGGESSSSSGGKKIVKLDLEDMIGNLEKWKQDDPDEYEYLKKLLHIPFVPPKDYAPPTVLIWYPSGKTEITRNDELDIYAYVKNDNPIEVRSDVYLWLEAKGPGEENYTRIGSSRVILANEYSEKNNVTTRDWSGITPFADSKVVGNATFRIWSNDMHSTYYTDTMYAKPYHQGEYYSLLELKLVNSPPKAEAKSIRVEPVRARYNDPIQYEARFVDADEDMVNVTLHVLDDQGSEFKNMTQDVKSGTGVTFSAGEYGIFGEGDAGKNFSYFYTYGDGLNDNRTETFSGPFLLPSPKIWVTDPLVTPNKGHWWEEYKFSIRVKNPDVNEVIIDLYTITPNGDEKLRGSKNISRSGEFEMVTFNVDTFTVSDAGKNFSYRFGYSEADQDSQKSTTAPNGFEIDPKIVRYPVYSKTIVANILIVLLAALVGGIMIERRLYR